MKGVGAGSGPSSSLVDLEEAVRPCWMELDLDALSHNMRVLRAQLGPAPGAHAGVLIDGRRVPLRGVSLEYVVLDLTERDDVRIGDEVVLLGRSGEEEILLADVADWQGAAPHEVLMGFEGRLRARYLEGSGD
jgi:alanine racemase